MKKQSIEERIEKQNNDFLGMYRTCRKSTGLALVEACKDIVHCATHLEPRGNRTRIGWAKSLSERAKGINKHALNSYLVIGAGSSRLRGHDELVQQWRKMSPLVALVRLPPDLFAEAKALGVLRNAATVKDLSGVRVQEQCAKVTQQLMDIKPGPLVVGTGIGMSAIPQPLHPRKTEIIGKVASQDLPLISDDPTHRDFLQDQPLFNDGWDHTADALQFSLPIEGEDPSKVALGIYKQYGSEFAKKVKSLL